MTATYRSISTTRNETHTATTIDMGYTTECDGETVETRALILCDNATHERFCYVDGNATSFEYIDAVFFHGWQGKGF